jgi:hypothetical protein
LEYKENKASNNYKKLPAILYIVSLLTFDSFYFLWFLQNLPSKNEKIFDRIKKIE